MHPKPLGCFTSMGLAAAIITAVAIIGVAFLGGNALFSAGPLSTGSSLRSMGGARSHADLSDDCDSCHTSFWGDEYMRDRCLKCHTEVMSQIDEAGSPHYTLGQPLACRSCHTEHQGAAARITRYDTILFPHDKVGFSLLAHQKDGSPLDCLECHKDTVRSFRVGVCQDCHSLVNETALDEHIRIFGQGCLGCHDGIESYGKNFYHDDSQFPLEGKHLTTDCESCHIGARDLDELRSTPQDCFACHGHEDFHEGSLGSECESCHIPLAWDAAAFDHNKTQFKLDGRHVALTCEACHAGTDSDPISSDCVSCHQKEDSHLGGLGNQCQICHQTSGWDDVAYDHALTEFQLEESHALLACNDCHAGIPLSEIPNTCSGCHLEEDAHEGTYGVQCEACHQPTTWQDVTFDHALSKFPLTGAHVGLPCGQCHIGGRFQEIGSACVSCHEDPVYHQGLFSYTCESCHNTSSWRPATFNQSHRFPFNHGGRSSSCRTCHPNLLQRYTCYNCHEHNQSEINEEHSEEGISNFGDCMRCHPNGRKEEGGDD